MPLDIFFTFPVLDADDQRRVLVRWSANARLQHHIEDLVQRNPKFNEATLAKVFLEAIRQSPPSTIAKNHLVAFLASFSYRSAARIKSELEQLNHLPSDTHTFLQDLFQSAFEVALNPMEFFKNFEAERSQDIFWYFSLKGYTRRKLEGLLRDKVRSIEGLTTYGRTDLGLAARSSEKRVIVALRTMGEPESKIVQFVLVWKCFQEARNAKILQVDLPQPQQFEAIAHRYNLLKSKPSAPVLPDADGPTIEQWLKTIGAAIRRYCDRRLESLDTIFNPNSETSSIWNEEIADSSTLSEGLTLTTTEIQSEIYALTQFLSEEIQLLESDQKYILLLKYGLKFNQTQAAAQLNKDQSFISRNHARIQTHLLNKINQWSKIQKNIDLSDQVLIEIKEYLIDYLDFYYIQQINHWIENAFKGLNQKSQDLSSHHILTTEVKTQIEKHIQRQFPPQKEISEKIACLIQDWLKSSSQ